MDSRSSPLFVTFGPGVSPQDQKIEKSITRSTVVSLVQQTCWTAADRVWCEKLATASSVTANVVNFAVTAIGMWGYTPLPVYIPVCQLSGVLVSTSCLWLGDMTH